MKSFQIGVLASSIALIALTAGCASEPDAEAWSDRVEMKERTVEAIESERERERAARQVPVEQAETTDAEFFALTPGEPYVTQSQLTVSLRKGSEPPQVSFAREGRVEIVTLGDPPTYQEGVVQGQLYSVRRMDDQLVVTMHSDLPTEPLSVDEALERARAEQDARFGCEGEPHRSEVRDNGTVVVEVRPAEAVEAAGAAPAGPVVADDDRISIRREGCQIVIGRYTRRPVEL